MSQAQEANDPYKEYQVILAQGKRTFAQSQEDHDEKDNIFSVGNMQAKSQIASLKPIKVHVPAAKEPISLISANKQDQHFNQTIKRSPIKQFLSPQYSSHSQTKSQIRMKILLQNNRLKSNVQILRKDLDYHRENELKVAHILKESKDKIADFKFSLKEKSKRITQVTENNIQLRAMLKELKEKANQLTSYSNWQQAQIRELNTKLQQTSKDAISKQKLQEKINNLQNQLKSCELVLQRNAEKSNQFSRCSLQQQIVSVHTLSQRNPEQWKSMNDLGIDEVQMIKERQENATSSQELVDLNQFNSSLRVRIEELQGELEGMKKILGEKQNKWSTALESNLKNSDNLKDEIERANSRSASMQQYLKEKQDLILSLRREVKQMSIQLTAKQQFISNLQKDRQQQGEQFSKTLEEFREKGQDMAEKILDRENMIKKAQQDYYMSLRERQDRFSKEKKELDEIINQLTQKMSLLEKRNDILQRQAEQMARQREEVSQMLEAAKRDYEQRSRLLEMVQHFKQQNQQLNLKVREQQASYQKQLQQKNMTYLQMQGYASQISQLKNIIHNLNFQQVIKKKSQKIIQQQDELESQQQSFQKEDDLPGNSECHGPLGRPGPLQQSEPLKESSDSSSRKDKVERNHKLRKSKHSEDSSQDYSRLKEKLQQEINAHNISLADINYKLEEQRYAKSQLQAKNNELYGEIRMLSTLNMENKLSLGMKDDEINKLNAMVAQSKAQFEQHARKINSLLSHNNRQMKQKSERIFQLGLQLDRMKTQNMQISQKVITLQSSNKKYDSQRALLASQLSMIKIQNNPLLQRQLQELRQSLALPFDSQYQEETRLFLSMRIQQKEKQLETKNRENFLKLQQRIAQMRLQSQCFYQKEVVFKKASQKIELMAREIGNLEGFLDQMRTQLREADLKVRSLQQQNQLKGKQLQEKAQIINKMIAESEKASKLFRTTQQQSKTLLAQSQQIKQENQAIKAKLTQHQNIISSLNKKEQKSRLQLEQKIQALQHIVDSQVSQLQKYSRQKQQLIADNFRASSDIAQSDSKIKQFSAENGLLIKKLDETQNKYSKAEGEIERLKEERDLIRKQNSELANKLKIIQEQIKIKDFKIQELDLNLANIQSSLQYSRTQNSQKLNALRESLTKQNELYLSVKMQEVSQTIKEIETLRNDIVELKNQHKATMEQYKRFKVQAQKEKQEYILRECESCTRIEQLQQVNFSFGNLLKQKTDQLIHVTNTVTEREILLKEKIQLVDETAQKIALLQAEISQITNDYETLKLNSQRQKQSLNDKIEVRKQIMQELEDDHEMRVNKLQKQVSTLRSLLTQTEKQTSVRLQQSTNSINQMQNKLKIYAEMVKQKDQELRQLKQAISSLKQQNEILKKMEQRNQQEKQIYEQAKKMQETSQKQLNKQLSELEAQLNEQQVLNKRAKIQIKQLQLQTEKAKKYISQLQNKTIKLQSNIAIYQENKVQMKKIADNFQEDIKKVKAEMAQVQRQNEISKSQILQTQAYLQDQILSKSLIQQMYQNIQLQKEQIFKEVSDLSAQRSELEEKVKEVQNYLLEERVQKAKIQHMYKQMQEKAENLSAKNMELQKAIKKAQKQKKEIEALLTQTQQYLQEEILQKSRVQEMHLRVLEQKQQMTLKLSQAISQQDQIKQSVNKSKPTIQQLKQQNHSLSLKITKMEKQHASRIQSMRTEMRDHGLQLQRRHSKQEQNLCEQMQKLRLERDNLKNELQKSKKNQKEQIQKVKSKLTIYEKEAKQFEFQRGQLTDKILQITSENNQFNQIIQTLRNDAMSKANELFQCKQLIQKLQEEIEQLKQNQPLCNKSLQPEKLDLYSLQQEYYQLEAIVYQLQAKNQILQSQINEKIKNQRNLSQKIEQLKVKQTRERNSSCDSWVSRSRIFVDEKSQNLQAELEDYKCKYESAEAYIIQLEEQIKQGSTSELQLKLAELQKEIKTKKEQIQNLQAKVEYQTAYIDHLQIDNIKNSVISKKSNHSKRDDKTFLKVDRDHSVVSVLENSRRSDKHVDAAKLNERIKSFNEFIQKYNREKDKSQLDSFRKQLGSAALDELLSTILYRLEKEANHFRQKQHQNQEILMDNQHLQEEIASLRSAFQLTNSKLQNYNNVQRNYEQTKSLLQQALMLKVKQQMQISQLKRRTKELQDSLPQNQDNIKQKQERTLTASMRREKQRDGLSVLHQENQDGSSDSMMSENADSQIPSSVNQSKDLLSSLDIRLKKSANIKMKSKTLSRANSQSNNQRTFNVQFLYTLLDKIDEIDSQVAYIQIELQEKAEKLAQMLGSSTMREQIASKLQQIQGKMHQNEKDIKRHIEKSQNELTNLLRELIRGIGGQNEYGLQNESRKKIEQYLKLLQSQLYKSKQYQQTKPLQSGRNQAHDAMKLNLHQIKEDIINEDKTSSLVNPKTSRMAHSYCNSEGVEPSQNTELKANYLDVLKELKHAKDQLLKKEELLRNISKKNNLVSQQISIILKQLLLNFQQNHYFFQQTDKIKQLLFHLTNNHSLQYPIKDSLQKEVQYQKMILKQSNAKRQSANDESKRQSANDESKRQSANDESNERANGFLYLAKIPKEKFYELVEQVTNEDVKLIKKRIEQIIQERYNDCFEFLINQKSLILDILKIDEKRSSQELALEKLANRLTKDEIQGIINNSYNKQEARMTLMKIIVQDSKSEKVSIEDDFSPNIDQMQQIKDRVFMHPTQLSLLLHNQLIKVLGAPTRQSYYEYIEQFYQIIRRYQQRINEQTSERQSHSEKYQIRVKKIIEQRLQSIEINDSQSLDPSMIRIPKNRSTSCIVNGTESIS